VQAMVRQTGRHGTVERLEEETSSFAVSNRFVINCEAANLNGFT
jgi:hypothetical protein